ncbi:tRNA (adenosine(37)-N6)-threonylcarbamoyltransferase complex transferase subunit TsaD [Candidatus Saccharibacteria bacterium]|nr:tRNA (adenosine(37)-N6)-threonylcarbamoyltransferase complex transferase subunit TsaD [Candidatus Saccharibacteria bacterium]
MKILGIETSCDETAAAVVEDGVKILSNVVVSQIDIFKEYGGVIPEVAARSHLEVMMPVVHKALTDAGCSWDEIDAIAVTHAPGLLGSLLIGTLTARTLAILHDKPLYAVHHLKSHVYANWLLADVQNSVSRDRTSSRPSSRGSASCALGSSLRELPRNTLSEHRPAFPLLALVISGGHTQILYMPGHNQFEIIGTTHDDAVGECFDKVAKILGLPYPGGPAVAKAALSGDAKKYKLPHPKVNALDFSFSGLKTAVLRAVQKEVGVPISCPSHKLKELLTPKQVADFAASFQKTAVDILVEKLEMAKEQYPDIKSLVVAGGVSANKALRDSLPEAYFPDVKLSGDNGAMVAAAAYYEIQSGVKPTDPYALNIYPRISIN